MKTLESEDDFEGSEEEYKFGPKHDISVVPYASNGALDNAYSVDGNIVTVSYGVPCKVGYFNGSKYIALDAVANDDGSYSFTVEDEIVEEVVLVIKGDVDLNGMIIGADAVLLRRIALQKNDASDVQLFAGDVNGDGYTNGPDAVLLQRIALRKTENNW